jgi:hypothetical protein
MLVFVETPLFSRLVSDYLPDDSYAELQASLNEDPERGKIIRGTGGVRKLRWASAGRGKSGGLRIIYYFKKANGEIWMLTLYAKTEHESIPAHILKQIREEIEDA